MAIAIGPRVPRRKDSAAASVTLHLTRLDSGVEPLMRARCLNWYLDWLLPWRDGLAWRALPPSDLAAWEWPVLWLLNALLQLLLSTPGVACPSTQP